VALQLRRRVPRLAPRGDRLPPFAALAVAAEADQLRTELLSHQHTDGGWGWLNIDESDAFGTGLALYSLAKDGLPLDHPSTTRARQFLIETQRPDGSWPVKGTKKAKATQLEPTSIYWGTCWSIIALAQTLPPAPPH
jgi:squalene cyclase